MCPFSWQLESPPLYNSVGEGVKEGIHILELSPLGQCVQALIPPSAAPVCAWGPHRPIRAPVRHPCATLRRPGHVLHILSVLSMRGKGSITLDNPLAAARG